MLTKEEMCNLIPALSANLHFNKLSEREYILSNVDHKHYLKIDQDVCTLLLLVDEEKTLGEITIEYNRQNNVTINPEDVYSLFYKKLANYGILKGSGYNIKPYQKPPYLRLSFIIINERILNKLVKHFYFFFNKKVALPILACCLLLIPILLYLNVDLYKSLNLDKSLLYFFVVMALSVTFHEIGHATSASYFGAKHGGIGGGFYLITPVYYADVTDIWRLSKRQRIIVNLSGMYFEIVFCSALAFLSTIFNNHTLLIISIIVCIRTLFNLNPFLRSDGYWVLSDLTNKPNLLYHSTEKAKDIARMIFKKKKLAWVSADYALMFYGVISYGFIFMLLYYVAIKNPNSIIHFPKNLFNFFKSIFQNTSEFSLVNFTELVIPLVFFILLVRLVKSLIIKQRG